MTPDPNFFLVYEDNHLELAEELAGARCQEINAPVKVVPGMSTLIFWGHGTPGTLCKLEPRDIADIIRRWKSSNSRIKSIEILTCNSRHAKGATDPFVSELRRRLGFRHRSLKIRALPIRMGPEGIHGESILFSSYKTGTWCYITMHSEDSFFLLKRMFKKICEEQFGDDAVQTATYFTVPPPRPQGGADPVNPFAKWEPDVSKIHDSAAVLGMSSHPRFQADFVDAMKDDAFRREFVNSRKYSMNYGFFADLRRELVELR